MLRGQTRAARAGAALVLLASTAVPMFAGRAVGGESDLKARMATIQAQLDAKTALIEALRTKQEEAHLRIEEIEAEMSAIERKNAKLQKDVIERADALYRAGDIGMIEMLMSADDLSELSERAAVLSEVSLQDLTVFVKLHRATVRLRALHEEMVERRKEFEGAADALSDASASLQDQFDAIAAEYNSIRRVLAPAPTQGIAVRSTGGMACPVAGPVSFVDSWGAPRAGHTHQGVDMMAAYGTPIVAIVSGTITYAAYDGSGGNMIFLSGDDGNAYWYMHNQQNLVTGGHVSVGQQIATVGDTGNAAGTPHLHFEFHPGGGPPVNPYPLVASIC